jgi:D-glucosaminate-6-phosphate ammonia-lyase
MRVHGESHQFFDVSKQESFRIGVVLFVPGRAIHDGYDVGSRLLGVDVVEVETPEQLEASMGPQTAMIYILSSPAAATGPLSIANICQAAKAKNVPVFVDAAAENLTIPNIHLAAGATFVGYSGGKCMRGPQCAGLLLGRKDLVRRTTTWDAP